MNTPNEQPVSQTPRAMRAALWSSNLNCYVVSLAEAEQLERELNQANSDKQSNAEAFDRCAPELEQANLYVKELEAVARAAGDHIWIRFHTGCKCPLCLALESLKAKGWKP